MSRVSAVTSDSSTGQSGDQHLVLAPAFCAFGSNHQICPIAGCGRANVSQELWRIFLPDSRQPLCPCCERSMGGALLQLREKLDPPPPTSTPIAIHAHPDERWESGWCLRHNLPIEPRSLEAGTFGTYVRRLYCRRCSEERLEVNVAAVLHEYFGTSPPPPPAPPPPPTPHELATMRLERATLKLAAALFPAGVADERTLSRARALLDAVKESLEAEAELKGLAQ